MIATRVSRIETTGRRERYATALSGLWSGLAVTLARLEAIAAHPQERLEEESEALPILQYSLHRAEEMAAGIDPPPGAEIAHRQLRLALAAARDLTGEVAARLHEEGLEAARALVPEWRGALFRVRLCRQRVAEARGPGVPEEEGAGRSARAAAVSTALVVGGTGVFTAGAVLALWPAWVAGLVLVALGFLVYRP